MTETERIARQLRKAFEGKTWHGPALLEVLDGVTAQIAAAPSPSGGHGIWQLVLHVGTWEAAVLKWLGGQSAQPSDAENWPAIADTSDAAWQATLERLKAGNLALRDAIAKLDPARLEQPIVEGMPSTYTTLFGAIDHLVYHTGQIALLKKLNA